MAPRVKVWLESQGNYAFGFGIAEILQAVDRARSIKQAAGDLGKSYRYVWGRIKKAEKTLGQQLVETQIGGKDAQRSTLTPAAQHWGYCNFLFIDGSARALSEGNQLSVMRALCTRADGEVIPGNAF